MRYAGDLSGCTTGPAARATLVRIGEHFSFAPSDGALVISGPVAADGSFSGTLVTAPGHQGSPGKAVPPFTLTVSGTIGDEAAEGSYATPRCHTAFHLPRIGATLVP